MDNLLLKFSVPLENAGVDTSLVCEEWKDMLEYAKQYLNLVQEPSEVIWWKLFNASYSSRWSNVLCLVQLLFCIPMSNGHVERTSLFSNSLRQSTATALVKITSMISYEFQSKDPSKFMGCNSFGAFVVEGQTEKSRGQQN